MASGPVILNTANYPLVFGPTTGYGAAIQVSGAYTGATLLFQVSMDGANYDGCQVSRASGTSSPGFQQQPGDGQTAVYLAFGLQPGTLIQVTALQLASGNMEVQVISQGAQVQLAGQGVGAPTYAGDRDVLLAKIKCELRELRRLWCEQYSGSEFSEEPELVEEY